MSHELRDDPGKKAAARPPHVENVIDHLRRSEAMFAAAGSGEEATQVGGPSTTPPPRAGFWARITRPEGTDDAVPVGDGSVGLYCFVELYTSNSTGGGSAPSSENVEALALPGGRTGVLNAYELTGKTDVPENSVVYVTHAEAAPPAAAPGVGPGGNAESYAFKYTPLPGAAADQKFARVTVAGGPPVAGCLHDVSDCGQCLSGAPPAWATTLSGGTGAFATANGLYVLFHTAGCVWVATRSGWTLTLTLTAGHHLTLALAGPASAAAAWVDLTATTCGGPLTTSLSSSSGAGAPTAPVLRASCAGASCTQGEGELVTPTAGPCGWVTGDVVTLEPLDAAQSLQVGHIYPVWLKTPATDDDPAVYLADSQDVNYYELIEVTYIDTTINYYQSTINYFDVHLYWSQVNITLLTDVTVVGNFNWYFGVNVVFTAGIELCGWLWYGSEDHTLWDPEEVAYVLDLTEADTLDPHVVARLIPTPQLDEDENPLPILLDGIDPIPGPDACGGQFLYVFNDGPGAANDAEQIILGPDFLVPGAAQLPLKLRADDAAQLWWDQAADSGGGAWRVMATTHGDFRFHASSLQTVTKWNAGREADFVPAGSDGDVLYSRDDGDGHQAPVWQPIPGTAVVYRDDCVDGFVHRYVSTLKFVSGALTQGSDVDGNFVPGVWTFDSVQGCCKCTEPASGPCCFADPSGHPDLCMTFSGSLADVGTVALSWGGSSWSGEGEELVCALVGAKAIALSCNNGLWDLDVSSCDKPTVTVVSCDPLTLDVAGPDCADPCGGAWTATITEASSGGCGGSGEPPPPGCCDDVPASITVDGTTYPLSEVGDCVYVWSGDTVNAVVTTEATGGFFFATVHLIDGDVSCGYSRAEADGCLGEYAQVGDCDDAFPATITVS